MADEIVKKGLQALDPVGNWIRRPTYETNEYPAIPEYINIIYRKKQGQPANVFIDAAAFLKHEGIWLQSREETKDGRERNIIHIGSKAETFKLYKLLNAFSRKDREEDMGRFAHSSAAIADNIIWHVFGPWIEKALELQKEEDSPILRRQAQSNYVAARDQLSAELQAGGMETEAAQAFAENVARVVKEVSQERSMRGR